MNVRFNSYYLPMKGCLDFQWPYNYAYEGESIPICLPFAEEKEVDHGG